MTISDTSSRGASALITYDITYPLDKITITGSTDDKKITQAELDVIKHTLIGLTDKTELSQQPLITQLLQDSQGCTLAEVMDKIFYSLLREELILNKEHNVFARLSIVKQLINSHKELKSSHSISTTSSVAVPNSIPLKKYAEARFECTLTKLNMTEAEFSEYSEYPLKDKLKDDVFLQKMSADEIDYSIVDIQENVAENGFHKLSLQGLGPVVANIKMYLQSDSERLDEAIKPYYTALIHQADELLAEARLDETRLSEVIMPYTNVMRFCIKYSFIQSYIHLLDFPDSYFTHLNVSRPNVSKVCSQIATIIDADFESLPSLITSLGEDLIDYIFENDFIRFYSYLSKWIKGGTYLIWPTFEVLSVDQFNKMSRYSIFMAGLTPQKLCYHDGVHMSANHLFCHDFAHAEIISSVSLPPSDLMQPLCNQNTTLVQENGGWMEKPYWTQTISSQKSHHFLKSVESTFTQLKITDASVKEAIDLVIFSIRHEFGALNHLVIDEVGNQKSVLLLDTCCLTNFFCNHIFNYSPSIKSYHLQFALILIVYVSNTLIEESKQ